jgi:hypothetical protein
MQGIFIHGLFNTRRTVSWIDIVDQPLLTATKLLALGLAPAELLHIQPDINIWVQSAKVTASDVPALKSWPLHPINHLKMDLVEFIMQKYTPQLLKDIGVTYDYLIDRMYMTFSTLVLFNFTWKVFSHNSVASPIFRNFHPKGVEISK